MSIWVKGNITSAYLFFGSTKAYVPTSAADEWQQIFIDGIAIDDLSSFTLSGSGSGSDRERYSNVGFYVPHTQKGYIIIDDISLIPWDVAEDIAQKITEIPQPEYGEQTLTLPSVDATDNITVSLIKSSDMDIIAPDGSIVTPKIKTEVLVTLQISDSVNTVEKSFSVTVFGEYDRYNVNGDGAFDARDLVYIRKCLIGKLNDICDVNDDDAFNLLDLVNMKKALVNM